MLYFMNVTFIEATTSMCRKVDKNLDSGIRLAFYLAVPQFFSLQNGEAVLSRRVRLSFLNVSCYYCY